VSRTEEVLQKGRRDLWKYSLPLFLDPVREFVVDPSLKFWTVVLPPFANWMHADGFVASTISVTSLTPMRFMLRMCATENSQDNARDAAKRQLLHPSTGMPRFRPLLTLLPRFEVSLPLAFRLLPT
jgi:hypothetical protein